MSDHTPGPWQAFAGIVYVEGHRLAVATHEADAQLMAAAPDLLAACEALVAFETHNHLCAVSRDGFECPECNRLALRASDLLRPAIAQARDEEPS